jgi:hypothetical protein
MILRKKAVYQAQSGYDSKTYFLVVLLLPIFIRRNLRVRTFIYLFGNIFFILVGGSWLGVSYRSRWIKIFLIIGPDSINDMILIVSLQFGQQSRLIPKNQSQPESCPGGRKAVVCLCDMLFQQFSVLLTGSANIVMAGALGTVSKRRHF